MAEERVKRRLTAILAADMVGYSRLMGADEAGTLAALKKHRAELIDPTVAAHDGRIVKLMGDGMLAEFASVVDAVQCAVVLQQETAARNADVPKDRRIEFRIGINLGDVILDGDDIYGDGVNIAARLESLAEPGGICISGAVHDAVGNKLAVRPEFMGEKEVKNIETPVRTYRIATQGPAPGASADTPAPRAGATAMPGTKRRDGPSLAVRPFDNLSGDPEQDHIANSITHGIITALIRVPRLSLIGDESPNLEKSRQMTAEDMGRQFDVQFVLSGSVHKLGDRLRVRAALMDVPNGRYLWAEDFDRDLGDLSDLFAIQDEITAEIVIALDVKLLSGEAGRIVRKVFKNPTALERYYQGEHTLWRSTTGLELREAQRLFEESISLEPAVSAGYAFAALAYWTEAVSGLGDAPERALAQAVELAREAIELGDVTGFPHLVLAHVHLSKREYDDAMAEVDRAVTSRPSCPGAYSLKASVLNYLGRPQEAIEFAQYAVRLTPFHPPDYPAPLASAYYGCGRYEDAIGAAKAALDLDESNRESYLILAASHQTLGRIEEARWATQRVRNLEPEFSLAEFTTSQPYKDQERLDRLLGQLRSAGLD
jgi:class 3 adenylate cyclase/tetratricopeptide (TPR) repeat protein